MLTKDLSAQNLVQKGLQAEVTELHITCLKGVAFNLISAHGIVLQYFLFHKVSSFPCIDRALGFTSDGKASHILQIMLPGPVAFPPLWCWGDKTTIMMTFCIMGLQQCGKEHMDLGLLKRYSLPLSEEQLWFSFQESWSQNAAAVMAKYTFKWQRNKNALELYCSNKLQECLGYFKNLTGKLYI